MDLSQLSNAELLILKIQIKKELIRRGVPQLNTS